MGARIEAAATASSRAGLLRRGPLHLSEAAARACLDRAHRRPDEIELLVDVGVYREKNLAEPSIASLVQEDIGANPGHPSARNHRGTFSFDVLDGGCGFVTAARIVDAFVGGGGARAGMIVAGDADPSPRTSRGFPFAPAAGAVVLGPGAAGEGFVRFDSRTFAEDAGLFESRLRFDPEARGAFGRRGRNVVEVREEPGFASRCVECARTVASSLLAAEAIGVGDVDLLVTSEYPLRFGDELARALGIPGERLPRVPDASRSTHTAGPIAGLEAAIASGELARARRTLIVTVGAGVTAAAALYVTRGG